MRFYRTLLEAADVDKIQSIIDRLEALLPTLSDSKAEQVRAKIAELKSKLPQEVKVGSAFDSSSDMGPITQQQDFDQAAVIIAEMVAEGVAEGWVQSNWRKIIRFIGKLKDRDQWEQAVEAYRQFDEEGNDMESVLERVAIRDFRFYVPYYAELRKLEVPHFLPDNPTRLKGQVLSNREWDENFKDYKVNREERKYEWIPGSGNSNESTNESLGSTISHYIEETYDGNDFFEEYGDMWFNEDEQLDEAEYQGRKVKLGKPMQGDVKKFKVYVKNPRGNIVKVNFGDPDMKIKKSNPARRKSFRARHNCDNPGPRHKARYWSCRKW